MLKFRPKKGKKKYSGEIFRPKNILEMNLLLQMFEEAKGDFYKGKSFLDTFFGTHPCICNFGGGRKHE